MFSLAARVIRLMQSDIERQEAKKLVCAEVYHERDDRGHGGDNDADRKRPKPTPLTVSPAAAGHVTASSLVCNPERGASPLVLARGLQQPQHTAYLECALLCANGCPAWPLRTQPFPHQHQELVPHPYPPTAGLPFAAPMYSPVIADGGRCYRPSAHVSHSPFPTRTSPRPRRARLFPPVPFPHGSDTHGPNTYGILSRSPVVGDA